MNLISKVSTKKCNRDAVLSWYKVIFIVFVAIISIRVATVMIEFANSTLTIYPDKRFIYQENNFHYSFYIRAFLYIFISAALKVIISALLFSSLFVVNVYILNSKLEDPLKNTEYISTFIYRVKYFVKWGFVVQFLTILLTIITQSIISFS